MSKRYINDDGYDDLLPRKVKEIYEEDMEEIDNDDEEDDDLYDYVESIETMFLMNNDVEHENIELDDNFEMEEDVNDNENDNNNLMSTFFII